jgi:hypothetical protein
MAVASWIKGEIALGFLWQPGTELGFQWPLGDAWLRFTAVTVTMHAFEPRFDTTAISIRETTVQDVSPSGRILWWTAYNSSLVPIRSVIQYVGVIGP